MTDEKNTRDANAASKEAKATLRRQMIGKREELDKVQARLWSQQIAGQLLSSQLLACLVEKSHEDPLQKLRIGLFVAMRQEVDLSSCWKPLQALGCQLCFPRMVNRQGQADLDFLAIPDGEDPSLYLTSGSFGVSEPAGNLGLARCDPDVIVLPGLAFDPAGHRLGWGKGYYDHHLTRRRLAATPLPVCIGAAYPFQIITQVPAADWDIPVDYLLSPDGIEPAR